MPRAPGRAARAKARAVTERAPKRRVRLDNDARRAQLLALARATFSSRAYDEVSIDDLAKQAKISKGLLYHYFPTKRDLYVAGLREIAGDLVQAVTSLPAALSPIDHARAGLDAYLDHITRHQRAFVSLMRGGIGSDPEVATVVESVRTEMFDSFLQGSPFTQLVAGDPRFETAVRGWIGFVEAATIDWCARAPNDPKRLPREEIRELLVQVLFEVVRVVTPQVFRLG